MTGDLDALLDDALVGGEEIHPSLRFRGAVMDSVRATARPPLPFPWRRIGLSAGLAAGAALLAAWELPVSAGSGLPLPSAVWLLPLAVLAVLATRLAAAMAGD
ncbi:MAG TPA: hypothetical protein VLT87_27190 [Thermoanaerobaculia bacterium]|nr:hypothetical protein [Thermoanaerobaculia bacterium]